MKSPLRLFGQSVLAVTLLIPAGLLAQGYEPDTGAVAVSGSGPTRRTPGLFNRLFNRPARRDPTDQLAYAQSLEADGRRRSALKAYKALFLFWPTAPEAPKALQAFARLLQQRGRHEAAFSEYQYLIDQYAGRFPYQAVIESQFALANQIRTERFGRWFFGIGFVAPERAIPLYFQIVSNAPNIHLSREALFCAAAIYQEKRQYEEAIRAYSDLQTRYPGTDEAQTAAVEQLHCMLGIARREPHHVRHTANTRDAVALYLREHPETSHREMLTAALAEMDARLAQTLLEQAQVYERARKRGAALDLYRELAATYPASPHADEARAKISQMESAAPK